MQYDQRVHEITANLILLNVARSKHHLPVHFTSVPSIAATFDFRSNVGFGGQFFSNPTVGADQANLYNFNIGASVAENPTIFVSPMEGEEFAKRLLIPMDVSKFELMVHQGVEPSIILRLMALAIVTEGEGRRLWYRNSPSHPEEYREFRRRVLHLSWLTSIGSLDVGPIEFTESWPVRNGAGLSPEEIAVAFENGYAWTTGPDGATPILSKVVQGRYLIANYDPSQLSNDERRRLNAKSEGFPRNFILVDIRPDKRGGEYPFQGWIQLRSFKSVLEFLGRGMAEKEEFEVEPDPRTGSVPANPAKTLSITETEAMPADAAFAITFKGKFYAIASGSGWDLEAFKILYQLFQLTVIDFTRAPTAPVTIAK